MDRTERSETYGSLQAMELQNLQAKLRVLEAFPSSYLISKRQSHFGVVIRVEITPMLLAGLREEEVAFDLHLNKGFPAISPIVNCLTHFTSPSIADGRDLTKDVLNGAWGEGSSLYDVVSGLPEFVRHCLLDVSPMALSIEIGTFHLGQTMYLNQWASKDTLGYFSCTEVTSKGEVRRSVVVSETVILQLEPSSTYIGTGVLLSWATLQSLANIKRSKMHPLRVTFAWKAIKDSPEYQQTFIIEDASACISLITANMSRLGVLVKRQNAIIEATLKEEEVTKRSLRDIHINDVLHAIAVYEANLDEKLTLEMINSLMGLYQKAVEYFSGVGDPRYDEFLERLHNMLSNGEIQRVIAGEKKREEDGEIKVVTVATVEEAKEEIKASKTEEKVAESGDLVLETPEIATIPPFEEQKEHILPSSIAEEPSIAPEEHSNPPEEPSTAPEEHLNPSEVPATEAVLPEDKAAEPNFTN